MRHDRPPRIAIIAIHGVGDHEPGATARAVASTLLSDPGGRYRAGGEVAVMLPAREPERDATAAPRPPSESWLEGVDSPFWTNARRHGRATTKGPSDAEPVGIDLEFSESLIAPGIPDPRPHSTPRIQLERSGAPGEPAAEIDVLELYWADLSRASAAGWAVARDLTQVVSHLASIGRTLSALAAVSAERAGAPDAAGWARLYLWQKWAYFLFSGPIMIWNLLLAWVTFLLLPALLPAALLRPAVVALSTATALAIGAYVRTTWLWRAGSRPSHARPGELSGLCATLGAAARRLRTAWPLSLVPTARDHPNTWPLLWMAAFVGVCAWAVAGRVPTHVAVWLAGAPVFVVVYALLLRSYEVVRPGAYRFGMASLAAVATTVVVVAWVGRDHAQPAIWTTLRVAECVYAVLSVAWVGLWAVTALSVAEALLLSGSPQESKREVVRTILLASSLSPALFVLVLLTLWTLAIPALAAAADGARHVSYQSILSLAPGPVDAQQFAERIVDVAAGRAFVMFLALLAVGGLVLVWGVLPGVLLEFVRATRDADAGRLSGDLGLRLTRGLVTITRSTRLVWIAFAVTLPLGCLATFLTDIESVPWLHERTPLLPSLGLLLGGATIGLTTLSGRVSDAIAKTRTLVDVALDIDNWLRERPLTGTPRFNIYDRFRRVVRSIETTGRGGGAAGADALVVVAHSQGTVVAADCLRYLHYKHEVFSDGMPVFMCTVGSPLHQLYAARLGGLYAWAGPGGATDTATGPDPAALGVRAWVNGYYAGDYVGRALWSDPMDPLTYRPPALDAVRSGVDGAVDAGRGFDICFGAGAHTHYFDGESPLVFALLDSLVARALAARANPHAGGLK